MFKNLGVKTFCAATERMISSKVSQQTSELDPSTGRPVTRGSTQAEPLLSMQSEIDRFVLEQILEEEDD